MKARFAKNAPFARFGRLSRVPVALTLSDLAASLDRLSAFLELRNDPCVFEALELLSPVISLDALISLCVAMVSAPRSPEVREVFLQVIGIAARVLENFLEGLFEAMLDTVHSDLSVAVFTRLCRAPRPRDMRLPFCRCLELVLPFPAVSLKAKASLATAVLQDCGREEYSRIVAFAAEGFLGESRSIDAWRYGKLCLTALQKDSTEWRAILRNKAVIPILATRVSECHDSAELWLALALLAELTTIAGDAIVLCAALGQADLISVTRMRIGCITEMVLTILANLYSLEIYGPVDFFSDDLCGIIARVLSRDCFGRKLQAFRIVGAIWSRLTTDEEKSAIPKEIVCEYLCYMDDPFCCGE
jgi:hypothetical protein